MHFPNVYLGLTLITIFLVIPLTSFADKKTGTGFYERKAEGWFWYEVIEEPAEPEPVELPEITLQEPTADPVEDKQETQLKPLEIFSIAWFKENLEKYQNAAIDNPTVENVKAFLYLQRYAMDKSERFADAVELATAGDLFLDENARRPIASYAATALDERSGRASDELILKIAEKAGIFFFYDSVSEASLIQAPITKMLETRLNFNVLAISLDHQPLPNNLFPNFKNNDGQAENLGVSSLPSLFLVGADHHVEPLAQSPLTLHDLKRRIILAAKKAGWISDEEFNKTKPIINPENDLAALLDTYAEFATKEAEPDSNFVSQEQLIEFIQQNLKKRL